MRISGLAAFAAFAIIGLTSCSRVSVNGDQESVLVLKPWFFGHGGVDTVPVTTGTQYVAVSTDDIPFVMTPERHEHKFDDMVTADHIPIDFSAFITLTPIRGKTPQLYKNGGLKWYENQVDQEFTNSVRYHASSHNMYDLCSERSILDSISTEVKKHMSAFLIEKMLPVTVGEVTIGAVTPPVEVLEETRRTAAQEQNKLTQTARASAELSREQAEINKAIADRSYLDHMGMTMEQYLALRQLEIQKEQVELVREKNNVSIILGTGLQPTVPIK